MLMSGGALKDHGAEPLARIVTHASHSHAPERFTTAPVTADKSVLHKARWKTSDVDLFEINEAICLRHNGRHA
jgi:acetyl-CoA C-acetyltransferase